MKRIYHPWDKWECFKFGFWKSIDSSKKEERIKRVVAFFGEDEGVQFDMACSRVVSEWKYSCEQNLTNLEMNRIAWLGQASVALELGIDQSTTMESWSHLTEDQKTIANEIAEKYLKQWEKNHES